MFHFLHHIHRIATIVKRVSADCVGEEVGIYRCCICRKTGRGVGWLFSSGVGEPENRAAYAVQTAATLTTP